MKKLRILTYHRPYNYGAVLQTLATIHAFKNEGLDVKIIDYRDPRIEKSRSYFCNFGGGVYNTIRESLRLIRHYKNERMRHDSFNRFTNQFIQITKPCINVAEIEDCVSDADYVVCGSDLIWNWELNEIPNEIYFLNFKTGTAKRFSYASSIGSTYIPDNLICSYKQLLSHIDLISVREKSTADLLEKIINKRIYSVLDPVLLHGKNFWLKYNITVKKPSRYICVYDVQTNPVLDFIVEKLRDTLKLPIVHFGRKKKYGKTDVLMYRTGPGEFINIIKDAEIVLTNSFHGVAFSVIMHKNFWCIPHTTRGVRMRDLLEQIDLKERIISDVDNNINFDKKINYMSVDKKLEYYKKLSFNYIKKALATSHNRLG